MNKRKTLYNIRGDIWKNSNLDRETTDQLAEYIWIFKSENMKDHWEVNKYIDNNKLWKNFDRIRSINTHSNRSKVMGIQPKYYAIVCKVLEIGAGGGTRLVDYEPY